LLSPVAGRLTICHHDTSPACHPSLAACRQILTKPARENALAAQIVNLLTDEGFVTPIAYVQNIFLAKPWLHDVVTNPFSWGNFYQLQYLKTG
jgi:hypothetical protein